MHLATFSSTVPTPSTGSWQNTGSLSSHGGGGGGGDGVGEQRVKLLLQAMIASSTHSGSAKGVSSSSV